MIILAFTNKDIVLNAMYTQGVNDALSLQNSASDMTADEILAEEYCIPNFNPEKQYLNYTAGFICISPSGNVVKLLQPYDSTIYTQDPEDLPAQWGFYWASDPKYAKPFVKMSTSPYNKGQCCTFEGHVWKSTIDTNVWSPTEYPTGWEDLGEISQYQ